MTSIEKVILADPCDVISVRVATPEECRELGLPLWRSKAVFVLTSPDGNEVLHPAEGATVVLRQAALCITGQPAAGQHRAPATWGGRGSVRQVSRGGGAKRE